MNHIHLHGIWADFLARIRGEDEGAGIVEYILLVTFIAVVLITSLVFFSGALSDSFSDAANSATP